MGIIVNGPFSNKPVKVRDQDAGRAVRDEEGRIFYVLPKSDGSGYYGAMTRAGDTKDEARALAMENKEALAGGQRREQAESLHDATGRRSGSRGKLLVLFLAAVVLALVWLVKFSPWKGQFKWQSSNAPPARIQEGGAKPETPATP